VTLDDSTLTGSGTVVLNPGATLDSQDLEITEHLVINQAEIRIPITQNPFSGLVNRVGETAELSGTVTPDPDSTLSCAVSIPACDFSSLAGNVYLAITANSLSGTFDNIGHSRIGGRVEFTPSYTATTASLTANLRTCPLYNDWRDRNFFGADRAGPSISGPEADPDLDGMTNFQDYVHATPPRVGNPSPVKLRVANALFLELTFPWADGMLDASFEAELGVTLDDFATVAHSVQESPSNGAVTHYAIRIFTTEVPNTGFVRLRTNLDGN
jgi:hypothetical protein